MKRLFVLLLVLSLVLCLGVTALAVEEGSALPADDGIHSHTISFMILDGDTRLSAGCSGQSCLEHFGELVLTAPQHTVYGDGKQASATYDSTMTSPVDIEGVNFVYEGVNGTSYEPDSTAPVDAGSYKVTMTVTVNGTDYALSRSYTIAKAAQDVPGAPTLSSLTAENITDSSIILTPYANSSKGNAWVEYSLDNKVTWTHGTHTEKGLVLSGLEPGTEYTIWARYEETDNYKASEPNATPLTVQTLDGAPTYILSVEADNIDTEYGAQAWTRLKITNSGNSTATITSVTLSGKDAGIYDVLRWDNPSDTVAPGATNETWFIRFKSAAIETGTYNCTVTVAYNNGATATKDIAAVVDKGRPAQPSQPPVIIDFVAETIHVDSAAPAEPVWAIGENRWDSGTIIGEGQSISAWLDTEGGKDLYLFVAESKNYVSSINETVMGGEAWAFVELLDRPDAPTSPAKQTDETIDGLNDGAISGVDDSMEYKLKGATAWTAVPESVTTLTGLADGTYLVRYKATDSTFASKSTEVTIAKGVPAVYALSIGDVSIPAADYNPISPPAAQTLTVTNSGNMPVSDIVLSLEGEDASSFTLSGTGADTLAVGSSSSDWTLQPKAGLAVGSYECTLVVTGSNNARATKAVSFTVNPAGQEAPADPALDMDDLSGVNWIAVLPAPNSNGSPMEYSLDGGQTWSAGTPDPADAQRLLLTGLSPDTEYAIRFRYGPSPDGNYKASEPASWHLAVKTMHEVKLLQGDGQVYYQGSSEGLTFVSSDIFDHFDGRVYVVRPGDGPENNAPLDPAAYTAEEGSVRITLKPEFLDGLEVADYDIIIFCDEEGGTAESVRARFEVKKAPAPTGGTDGDDVVKTGDSREPALWALVSLGSALALAGSLGSRKKKTQR